MRSTVPPSAVPTLSHRLREFLAPRRPVSFPALLTAWLPLAGWMVLIYSLSAQPALPHPGRAVGLSDLLGDYAAHAATFGVLTLLAWRALGTLPVAAGAKAHLGLAAAVAAAYGAFDEIHQSLVPGRCATLPDWLADLAGVAAAVGLVATWHAWRARHNTRRVM